MEDVETASTTMSEACFLRFASLSRSNFFSAIKEAGFPDISSSPLAGFVFDGLARGDEDQSKSVTLNKFQEAIDTARKTRTLFQAYTDGEEGISLESFQQMGIQFLGSGEECVFPSVRAAIQPNTVHISRLLVVNEEVFVTIAKKAATSAKTLHPTRSRRYR